MDITFILACIIIIALIVMALYGTGYRLGWDEGYDAAYRRMIKDLQKGKELFGISGLMNWEVPVEWGRYTHSRLPEVEDPELVGRW